MLNGYIFRLTAKLNQDEINFYQILSEPIVALHKADGTTDKDFYKFLFADNIIKLAETNPKFKAMLEADVKHIRGVISRLIAEATDFKTLDVKEIADWKGHPDLHGFMESLYKIRGGEHIFNKESVFLSKEDCTNLVDLSNKWLNRLDIEGDQQKDKLIEVDKVVQCKEQLDAQVLGLCREETDRVGEYENWLESNPPKDGELRHTDGYFFNKSNKADWLSTIEIFQKLIDTFDFERETLVYKASF